MINIIKTLFFTSIILIVLLITTRVFADDFLELQEVKVQYKDFLYARDPLFTLGPPKEQLNVQINNDILGFMYWNTMVHGTSDNAQYRRIGLQMELGVRLSNSLEVEYHHHSQHMLDSVFPYQKFPVEDSIDVNLYLYRTEKKRSIF